MPKEQNEDKTEALYEEGKSIIRERDIETGHELVEESVLTSEDLELLKNWSGSEWNQDENKSYQRLKEIRAKVHERVLEKILEKTGIEKGNKIRVMLVGNMSYEATFIEINNGVLRVNMEGAENEGGDYGLEYNHGHNLEYNKLFFAEAILSIEKIEK